MKHQPAYGQETALLVNPLPMIEAFIELLLFMLTTATRQKV